MDIKQTFDKIWAGIKENPDKTKHVLKIIGLIVVVSCAFSLSTTLILRGMIVLHKSGLVSDPLFMLIGGCISIIAGGSCIRWCVRKPFMMLYNMVFVKSKGITE